MTPVAPNVLAGRIVGATLLGLLSLLGIWAGARIHANRLTAAVHVPVGEASPPTVGDVDARSDAVPHVAHRIPPRIPDFSLGDRNGKLISVGTWAGRSLVLNFWATWCAPCRREIPLLEALAREWQAGGVEVVGVAVDHRDKVAAYVDDLKIAYPILVGEEDALDVAAQFGVDTPVFPFTVFTDRHGDVVTLYIGELHRAQADVILSAVRMVNEDRLELAEAQRNIARDLRALTAASSG